MLEAHEIVEGACISLGLFFGRWSSTRWFLGSGAWSLTSSSVSAYLAVVSFLGLLFFFYFRFASVLHFRVFLSVAVHGLRPESGAVPLLQASAALAKGRCLWNLRTNSGRVALLLGSLAGCSEQWTIHVIARRPFRHPEVLSISVFEIFFWAVSPSVTTWTICAGFKTSAWSSAIAS